MNFSYEVVYPPSDPTPVASGILTVSQGVGGSDYLRRLAEAIVWDTDMPAVLVPREPSGEQMSFRECWRQAPGLRQVYLDSARQTSEQLQEFADKKFPSEPITTVGGSGGAMWAISVGEFLQGDVIAIEPSGLYTTDFWPGVLNYARYFAGERRQRRLLDRGRIQEFLEIENEKPEPEAHWTTRLGRQVRELTLYGKSFVESAIALDALERMGEAGRRVTLVLAENSLAGGEAGAQIIDDLNRFDSFTCSIYPGATHSDLDNHALFADIVAGSLRAD